MSEEPASWELTRPSRFTAGAVGEPGHRVFYFQAFGPGVEVNVKCEKQQVTALAEHLVKLLADLPASEPVPAPAAVDALPPNDIAFVVGSISIGVDHKDSRLVVVLEELIIDPDDDEPVERDPARLRVHLTAEQVQGFAGQVSELVSGSRPLCRLCEQPIDPEGHACPRLN